MIKLLTNRLKPTHTQVSPFLSLFSLFVIFVASVADADTVMVYGIETTPEEQRIISTLENDNRILDSEIEKCEKKKKGWIAATVIGSVGVVATGTAAAVQAGKIKQEKAEFRTKQGEYDALKTEKDNIK